MRVRYAFLAALLFAGFGCSALQPAAVTEPGSKVSRNGCTVDPKQICQMCLRKLDQREISLYLKGAEEDTDSLDQEEGPHRVSILTDYRYPNGEQLALVYCVFDMRTHRVTGADLGNRGTPATSTEDP